MTTIINTPRGDGGESGAFGLVIGLLILLLVVGAFVLYGLPRLRDAETPAVNKTEIKVEIPTEVVPKAEQVTQ